MGEGEGKSPAWGEDSRDGYGMGDKSTTFQCVITSTKRGESRKVRDMIRKPLHWHTYAPNLREREKETRRISNYPAEID